ncbi:hypothetical protein ACWCOM_06360 [Kocuria sp. KH4]
MSRFLDRPLGVDRVARRRPGSPNRSAWTAVPLGSSASTAPARGVLLRENPLPRPRPGRGQRLRCFATMWTYLSGSAAVVRRTAPMLCPVAARGVPTGGGRPHGPAPRSVRGPNEPAGTLADVARVAFDLVVPSVLGTTARYPGSDPEERKADAVHG